MNEETGAPRADRPQLRKRLEGLSAPALLAEGLRGAEVAPARPGRWSVPSVGELRPLLPDYELVRSLGHGGMGSVYLARHLTLKRDVAVKVLPVELGEIEGMAIRFRTEAEVLARVRHPGIVAVYDFGTTRAGHLYYTMEHVEGEDLATRLARGPVPLDEAVRILTSMAEALAVLHRCGIVHRDIKPANILLAAGGHPRLVDFGLATSLERELDSPRLTRCKDALGTLEYAAPEQLAGGRVGPAADLYSLGVVAYELLTGDLPRGVFDPPSVRNRDLDPAFDGEVMAALQSDPDRRPKSAREFGRRLGEALVQRTRRTVRERRLRMVARRRFALVALLGCLALGTGTLAWFAWRERRSALAEKARAERFQAGAEALITFMVEDLEARLEELGRLELLDESLLRAEHYFEQTGGEWRDDDPAALTRQASFYRNRAIIHRFRGDYQASLADFRRGLPLRERAHELAPGDLGYRFGLARCLIGLGESHALLAEPEEALHWAARAQQAVAGETGRPPRRHLLLMAWVQAGSLEGRMLTQLGRHQEARARLESVFLLALGRTGGGTETREQWRLQRALVERDLAALEAREGNHEAALGRLKSALLVFRGMQDGRDWKLSTARAHCESALQLGTLFSALGRWPDADAACAEAAGLIDEMRRRSPDAPYAVSYRQRCESLRAMTRAERLEGREPLRAAGPGR